MPRSLLALAVVCAIAATTVPAIAAPEGDETAARADFSEGAAQFRSKKWADALKSFERSYAQVASPNAELMVARCLRELGRPSEAVPAFAAAEAEARKRVAKGEAKYADTADAAAAEGGALRASVGTMKIHVAHSTDATLYVDRKPVTLSSDGYATVVHPPGAVQVVVKDPAGVEQRQTATAVAGGVTEMEFTIAEKTASAPPLATSALPPPTPETEPAPEKRYPSWFLPATIIAGGATVLATGLGVGFGLSSKSAFDDLAKQCGPHCAEGQLAEATTGQHQQTLANVSYGIAIAGVVATAVILYLGITSDHHR